MAEETRPCIKCGEEWLVKDYQPRRRECPSCVQSRNNKAKRDKVQDAERHRRYSLKTRFGITLEQYEEMLEKQNHSCAVCLRHKSEFKTRLAVDHNHKTREIRGLLCTNCNLRLIARHRDGELLRRMAEYVEQGTGWLVPENVKPRKRYRRHKKKEHNDK